MASTIDNPQGEKSVDNPATIEAATDATVSGALST
jgi:hypothetical protein